MIEIERTYLAKYIPKDIKNYPCRKIMDIYVPKKIRHPVVRIRKSGDKFEITKKQQIGNDPSKQKEETITLTKEEFEELSEVEGKRTRKIRYYYDYGNGKAEIGIFKDEKEGLVLIDFEFESEEEENKFEMPDFCLVEVTDEEFLAGGMLCGKSYQDIEKDLKRFNYKKLFLD